MKEIIKLSKMEIQSNHNRVNQAEKLIEQLPETHEGRNSWLMNFGISGIARAIRKNDSKRLKDLGYVPRELQWDSEHDCLHGVDNRQVMEVI